MSKEKNTTDLVDWIESMHLQNTNGRETDVELFRLGIWAALEELDDLKLLNIDNVINRFNDL
tara:strand:+ start:36 stop:221 length:186 start_codon:yes stop_codon:yes gene_type:complete